MRLIHFGKVPRRMRILLCPEWFWCRNFMHNSPMWRVVVGGEVMVGHPSTNHNSPHGRVVHKIVSPEFSIVSKAKELNLAHASKYIYQKEGYNMW